MRGSDFCQPQLGKNAGAARASLHGSQYTCSLRTVCSCADRERSHTHQRFTESTDSMAQTLPGLTHGRQETMLRSMQQVMPAARCGTCMRALAHTRMWLRARCVAQGGERVRGVHRGGAV